MFIDEKVGVVNIALIETWQLVAVSEIGVLFLLARQIVIIDIAAIHLGAEQVRLLL